jgi:hypothetical protein
MSTQGHAQASEFPKIDFTTFILSISSAAFMGLGIREDAAAGSEQHGANPPPDLELARQNIDLLELMLEKTRGNLSKEEAKLLEQLLFETRMHFVEALRRIKS